jgi:hypothetical protein
MVFKDSRREIAPVPSKETGAAAQPVKVHAQVKTTSKPTATMRPHVCLKDRTDPLSDAQDGRT